MTSSANDLQNKAQKADEIFTKAKNDLYEIGKKRTKVMEKYDKQIDQKKIEEIKQEIEGL